MDERHSVRLIQKKEIPQETLKSIISTALDSLLGVTVNHGIFMLLLEIL